MVKFNRHMYRARSLCRLCSSARFGVREQSPPSSWQVVVMSVLGSVRIPTDSHQQPSKMALLCHIEY
ncbi:hypothetical protein E2C01_049459 [Portunus trituberculatus]|uniref:Uncharacterized protein n=1 Tax=Portunus trituberculatus TaxID=210409 RepID=A0A5B7G5L1_PORTR|nr:hypothetical protein [Portunus trituberculatus]